MDDPSRTRRWVAPRGAAGQAASAFARLTLRRAGWWAFLAVVELLAALAVLTAMDDRPGLPTRVAWSLAYAVGPTVVVGALTLLLSHLLNRRMFGRRLREGTVLEAAMGDDELLLRGPWAQSTLSFAGIEWARTQGRWLFLKQVGSPVLGVWPAELFDTRDLARLERALRSRGAAGSPHTGHLPGVDGS